MFKITITQGEKIVGEIIPEDFIINSGMYPIGFLSFGTSTLDGHMVRDTVRLVWGLNYNMPVYLHDMNGSNPINHRESKQITVYEDPIRSNKIVNSGYSVSNLRVDD
ncbi:hypothetical protein A2767_01325 [Candidatus Roizmanbacteria bacterium RIFCSPHIGHO2_01_FULL_35_10]|uniref:Uncharacterized protein n=1 Tax=Candidatus Roizmanbacteria bacterium RIFCSPLOWO2_01_FULL_35_13 TaxID=1802055 RepID=A0A1F7I7R3_9BACT|nr:MAG: hypothetical protein A2767_01325 [Candidatus Roizmanbacteria bacterium RIFCSPHIGHO2_01_FULL_35_10]OGK39404.1 MAG: hypothetical protein A3A74_06230 [Candidatus Roizmanbacteria bacterium RIFCSPLOWO2_01_FULL_35_13]